MLVATHSLIPIIGQLPIVAQGDGDGESILPLIVWAVIGFFWVLAQISQKKKEFQKLKQNAQVKEAQARNRMSTSTGAPPPPRERPDPTPRRVMPSDRDEVEDEMRRFLEQLTGNAPQPKPAPPAPVQVQPTPPPLPELQFDPPPVEKPRLGRNEVSTEFDDSIYELDDVEVYKTADEIIDIAELESQIEGEALHASQALVNVSSFIIKFDTLTVPIMSTDIISMRPVRTKTSHPKFTDRKIMRQSVVSRIVLSQPKALHDDIFKTDQGAL